jgi:hypothetical protein
MAETSPILVSCGIESGPVLIRLEHHVGQLCDSRRSPFGVTARRLFGPISVWWTAASIAWLPPRR